MKVAKELEDTLQAFEAILETSDIAPLYPASRNILAALRDLHDGDSTLLSPEGKARIDAQIEREKKKRGGRDSFNTGF